MLPRRTWIVTGLLSLALGTLVSVPPATAATPVCQVTYSVTNSWPTGFQGSVNLTNNGAALTSWSVGFAFPGAQAISNSWGGIFAQNGPNVTFGNEPYNGNLGTGQSVSIGFTAANPGTTGDPVYFTLNGVACNGAQQLPAVSLTSPAAFATYTPGSDVSLAATASDVGTSIGKVEFYNGSTLLGTSLTSPYTFTWAAVPQGYYALTAKAYDTNGVSAFSTPVNIEVVPPGGTAPALHVAGNQLVDATGKAVVLHGVNRSGGEFACVQGNGLWNGPMDEPSVAAMRSWHITAVRVPLNEACWNSESYVNSAFAGSTYQNAVRDYVTLLHKYGIVAILDLHWTDGLYTGTSSGCANATATCQKPMTDSAQSIPFWTSVATTFGGDDAVIFDLFNEPYPERADNFNETVGWQCWRDGGSSCVGIGYSVAGMQSMVNAVRTTGAQNVIMLGGLAYSNDLTQWLQFEPTDPAGNLVASWHSYNFNVCNTAACWTSQIAPVAAKVPVIAGEMGENDCAHGYIDGLMSFLDAQKISYLGWTWNNWDCAQGPSLITDYTGTPTAFGVGLRDHLRSLP